MDTSVSIVEARCRALMAAARWNGQAAQVTTGRARAPATQPQLANWKAGNIDIRNTGTVRMAATIRRGRSLAAAPRVVAWRDATGHMLRVLGRSSPPTP